MPQPDFDTDLMEICILAKYICKYAHPQRLCPKHNLGGAPTSTWVEPVGFTSCPAVYNPECPFLCGSPNAPGHCGQEYAPPRFGCSPCPGGPKACPTVKIPSCAWICKDWFGIDDIDASCSPTNITTGLGVQAPLKCEPCGTPKPIIDAPSESCSTPFSLDYPFLCKVSEYAQNYTCSPEYNLFPDCLPCNDIPSTCPEAPLELCTWLCSNVEGTNGFVTPFCSPQNRTSRVGSVNSPVNCVPCAGASGGNFTPPVYNNGSFTPTTPIPQPTYSSGASVVNMGTAAVLGLLCIAFAF
ncbi:hypothetical protein ABW20_dc0107392 [Dactylellina cionopaga]|nr:hypothetical protein ABW20_dc0107392 [Dactylellina cionopaga]